MKKYIFLLLPALIFGDDLKTLLDFANKNNILTQSTQLAQDAKSQDIKTKETTLYPSIDIGGFYQHLEYKPTMQPGDTYSAFAKISYDIYDGGKKDSLINIAKNEYKASEHNTNAVKQTLSLDITQDFYLIKNLKASLVAKKEAEKSLEEQLNRVKKYFEAKLATKNDIDRLQSSFDTNSYEIEAIKFQILQATNTLGLKVGKKIDMLDNSTFVENLDNKIEENNIIKSLKAKKDVLQANMEVINSTTLPQVKIENTYSRYGYNQTDATHPAGLDSQNNLTLSAVMRLYDFGIAKNEKQSVAIQVQALSKEIDYKIEEQKTLNNISLSRIDTSKAKIKSAKSALTSANSAFGLTNEKYNAGLVDYVSYLDALTAKTNANVAYEISLNELQLAYAVYYFYSGKNLGDLIYIGDLK